MTLEIIIICKRNKVSVLKMTRFGLVFLIFLAGCSVEGARVKRIIGGDEAAVPPFFDYMAEKDSKTTTTTTPSTSTQTTEANEQNSVFVKRHRRKALINGITNSDGTSSFLGIRYAEAPVKRLRFQRPRLNKLKGEVDATKYGPPCPQPNPQKKGSLIGNEDCLFLNVFTPSVPSKNNRTLYPVLVWIHGGNYKTGSGAQYYPTDLVKKGVVVVTINYRLGSLGFLSIKKPELSGNVGLFDISQAMRWVKNYIIFFGGNAKKIVPAGQGSGASSATMLALNKFTKSSLSGILAMSGTPISPFALDENEVETSKDVGSEDKCNVDDRFVKCLQDLPLEEVVRSDFKFAEKKRKKGDFPKGMANLENPGPAEEGADDNRFLPYFIVESPLQAIKKGIFPKIPLMTGVTNEETGGGVKGNFLEDVQKKLLSPNFLQNDIFQSAFVANTGLYVNKTVDSQLQSLFLNGDYLKFFTSLISSALSDIQKVVKHTTDAFFNLPAFITSHLWSQKTIVYLYSFEHIPENNVGERALLDVPLASSGPKQEKTGAEHGDDLVYLFDIRSLEGEPLDNKLSETDLKVRDKFTTMVANFARSGVPSRNWKPFNSKDGNYMIIKDEPTPAKDFHKCEMGLWSGDEGLLKSPQCSVIGPAADMAKSAGATVLNTINDASSRLGIDKIKGLVGKIPAAKFPTNQPISSLLNPFGNKDKTNQQPLSSTTPKKGLISGLTGGFGSLG